MIDGRALEPAVERYAKLMVEHGLVRVTVEPETGKIEIVRAPGPPPPPPKTTQEQFEENQKAQKELEDVRKSDEAEFQQWRRGQKPLR